MKKIIRNITLILFLLFGSATINNVLADDPAPPPLPGEHGMGGNKAPGGGGAPIGSGLGILLGLGLAYGATKVIRKNSEKVINKNSEEE